MTPMARVASGVDGHLQHRWKPRSRSETWGTRCRGGLEVGLVVLDGAAGLDGREEVGEGVGQALLRGGDGRPHGGAEQPEVGGAGSVGCDADAGEGVVGAEEIGEALGVEEGAELG